MAGPKSKKPLKVAIVRFPASNCDYDTLKFFSDAGHKPYFVWYKEKSIGNPDLLVLPGGFAFGDRVYAKATHEFHMDPGMQALKSPIMDAVKKAAKKGIPILGICNGFQILVHAGILPGKLKQNDLERFVCDWTICKVEGRSFFNDKSMLNKEYRIPIAHGWGNYYLDSKAYMDLKKNNQIFLEYVSKNPNGSYKNIAGVSDKAGKIFGMMPHPERSIDKKYFMIAIEKYVRQ